MTGRRGRIGTGLAAAGVVVAVVATWLPWLVYESGTGSRSGWDLVSHFGDRLRDGAFDTGPHWILRTSWCEYPTSTIVTALPIVAIAVVLGALLCLVATARRRGWRRAERWGAAAIVVGGAGLLLGWIRNLASVLDNCVHLGVGAWLELPAALLVLAGGVVLLLDARRQEHV